jgi:acyl-[acyl-carrier-protein] desaturase
MAHDTVFALRQNARRLHGRGLLEELGPVASRLFDQHLSLSREWFPHELIPYERGREVAAGEHWSPADTRLGDTAIDDAVRSALVVNLLTEDNLPYYYESISRLFGGDGDVWAAWARRWTAEEARHSMVIYGYLMVTRAVDPVRLERARMVQVSSGVVPQPPSVADGLVYVALQELATRVAHRNTGRRLDAAGDSVMKRVGADENLHHLFYRDLVSAALELDPSTMIEAIERQVTDFEMPGVGIPQFKRHAAAIASAGIYDLSVHHFHVLEPVVERRWAVADLDGLDTNAARARDRLMSRLAKSERVAQRLQERRDERRFASSAAP